MNVATALCRRFWNRFAKRLDTARRLQNSLLEFRRCINDCERLAFPHETARTSAAHRDDVSRTDETRYELRRNFLHRRAHDWNFLPAHMLGKKTGPRKRRFFCNIERRAGERLSALLALLPARSKRASAETDRALTRGSGARAGRTPHGQGTGRALDRSFNRAPTVQAPLWNDISSVSSRAPDGSCFGPGAARRSRRSSEKREWL